MREDRNQGGSATLQTLAILLYLTLTAAAVTGLILLSSRLVKHNSDQNMQGQLLAAKALRAFMDSLDNDEDPEADSPLDPLYSFIGPEGTSVKVEERSSLLNPNWLAKPIMDETEIRDFLVSGKTGQDVQQFREDQGLQSDLSDYKDLFAEEARKTYLTLDSYAQLDSTDEFALRKLFLAATGNAGAAEVFHSKVQGHIATLKMGDASKLREILGLDGEEVSRYLGLEPQMNVNFVQEKILRAILSYSPFKVNSPQAATAAILSQRASHPLKTQDLEAILGTQAQPRIKAYLGTRSWFWRVGISTTDGANYQATVARRLPGLINVPGSKAPPCTLIAFQRLDKPEDMGNALEEPTP
jgi:hypothetical protein